VFISSTLGSHYGVSDLEALARNTHKFDSRYLGRLIGGVCRKAGPLPGVLANNHAQRLAVPPIFFQATKTRSFRPIKQKKWSTRFAAKRAPGPLPALRPRTVWRRKAENIQHALDAEIVFLLSGGSSRRTAILIRSALRNMRSACITLAAWLPDPLAEPGTRTEMIWVFSSLRFNKLIVSLLHSPAPWTQIVQPTRRRRSENIGE